jgi:hypothetical protein
MRDNSFFAPRDLGNAMRAAHEVLLDAFSMAPRPQILRYRGLEALDHFPVAVYETS